jgi:hypothetical protein
VVSTFQVPKYERNRAPRPAVVLKSLYFNRAPRHEGVLGSGGITPSILSLGTR